MGRFKSSKPQTQSNRHPRLYRGRLSDVLAYFAAYPIMDPGSPGAEYDEHVAGECRETIRDVAQAGGDFRDQFEAVKALLKALPVFPGAEDTCWPGVEAQLGSLEHSDYPAPGDWTDPDGTRHLLPESQLPPIA